MAIDSRSSATKSQADLSQYQHIAVPTGHCAAPTNAFCVRRCDFSASFATVLLAVFGRFANPFPGKDELVPIHVTALENITCLSAVLPVYHPKSGKTGSKVLTIW